MSAEPKQGKNSGIDYYRDPVNADRINQDPDEIMKALAAAKAGVMDAQRRLLESQIQSAAPTGPFSEDVTGKTSGRRPHRETSAGHDWERLASMRAEEIRQRDLFPYVALPHPLQTNGGMVFPKMQLEMFPRLERVDVDFDLPDAFLPEFPPAIFLSNRPELGDVSRGEVISINNYFKLFQGYSYTRPAGWTPPAGNAISAGRIQSHG